MENRQAQTEPNHDTFAQCYLMGIITFALLHTWLSTVPGWILFGLGFFLPWLLKVASLFYDRWSTETFWKTKFMKRQISDLTLLTYLFAESIQQQHELEAGKGGIGDGLVRGGKAL